MELKKATRKQVKLRLGISAMSGGGKTYSALLLAKGLIGVWDKIAVIDTENDSASLYSNLGDFNTISLHAPYTPERYIQAIKACEDAGMECIIIDSITHEWDGKGGLLDDHSKMTGNSFTNWSSLTPRHQKFIDAMLQSKCHVITTVRRKTEYEITKDTNGKTKVEKLGLREVTRDGFEYELTVNFNLDERHNCTASKDRTGLFMDKPFFTITEETGEIIMKWCNEGKAPIPEPFKTVAEKIEDAKISNSEPKFESTTHDKPFLNRYVFNSPGVETNDWAIVSRAVADHKCTIEYVESKFKISKDTKEALIELQKTGK